MFKEEDGRPKATAGVLLYIYSKEGDAYLLLGRERIDLEERKAAGKYSEFSGSMELVAPNKPETFLEGCLRECREETASIYNLHPSYALSKSYLYFDTKPQREIAIIIIEAPKYVSREDLLLQRNAQKDIHMLDKDDFKWLKVRDFIHNKPNESGVITVKDLEGNSTIIPLRSFFLEYLKDENFLNILRQIDKKNAS